MVRKVVFLFHVIPFLHTCLSETKVITLSKIGFIFKLNLKASKTGGKSWMLKVIMEKCHEQPIGNTDALTIFGALCTGTAHRRLGRVWQIFICLLILFVLKYSSFYPIFSIYIYFNVTEYM